MSNFPPQMGGQMMQSRPPQNGNASAHIQQMIYATLNQQSGPLSGWQVSVLANERMGLIFNIIGNLRLASQHQPNPPTLQRMIEIGIRFEKEIFEKSPNKEHYKHQVQMKLEQLLERRNQNQASMQQQIQQQAQAQAQAQQAQAQQMMMNPNAMQGQGPRPMPQGGAQQGFSHLQHQMQASPIPGQQPPQAPMGMQNQGAQNMTSNQQQQFANAMQQGQSQQNLQGRMPNNGPQLSPQDNALVIDLTNRLSAQASEEEKAQLRNNLRQRMDAQQYAKYQSQGIDPVLLYFRNQAVNRLRQEKAMRVQQQQQVAMGQQPQNGPGSAQPMQQQRSMNPSPLNGQNPPPTTVGGNPDFGSFMGSMGDLAQQQAQGARAQAGGEMVVPVSGAPRNATPQPGVMAGQNMAMNDQRGSANQNPNAQQRQSMLNAQQIQAQRLHHAQQQQQQQQQQQHQSQAQARMQAQVQAQQIALQGQVGGMGPGPVNTQPSPAMPTLNTPIRTPSQQQINQPENPTINPNAQFGQPLDPRFMQGNQRQPNPGNAALTQAMYSQMPPEARETLSQMSPEKLNEVVSRWHASRLQQEMNPNGQGRPQMQMQGGGQVRPGQPLPQGGPFNPQNPAAQFMGGGQRPPGMAANMNPQQQLLLQQQIAALRPGQMPQRGPQNLTIEQRVTMQMDGVDVPQVYLNHQSMPQGVPPDIKKWGQLKQWVGTNTALGPAGLESVKNLQKLHYTNIIRSRQQNSQAGMMQPGMPGPPGMSGIPGVSPGMAAPVAPMGQTPVQMPAMSMPNGLRQPTPQEIATLRNHPSGKMRNFTDDQIRQIFRNNNAQLHQQRQQQLTAQQQQLHQQSLMAAQMNRMGQQAPQPNMAVSNPATAAPPKPSQTPQPKPQPTPEPVSAPNNANANAARAARPQPNDRNAAQNSSPAQATKNLKRSSSSDDVIEVPNPNAQRPQHNAPNSQEGSQPGPPRVTPQQIAALNPEQRKAYEVYIKKQQMNQANSRLQVNPIDLEKLKAIEKDEQQKSTRALPDLPLDEEYKNKMTAMMQNLVSSMQNVNKTMPRWFQITHNEERARQFYHARFRFAKQFNDGETMQQLKGNFSITLQEVDSTKKLLNTIIQDLTSKFPNMKKQDGGKPAPTATAQPAAQAPSQSGQPTPLNAANLQQQQQQLKMHQRSNSRSSHTPAAPTSEQPPIQFGGARSPHGAPSYLNNNTLTQENMHIPARKKQKQNSTPVAANGQGTPGSTASPKTSKVMSPEMKRQAEAKSLTCPEPECERSNVTFDTQEALDMHRVEEHVKPLENPLRFVQESLTSVSGLDSQGYAKKISNPDPVTNSAGATSGVKMMQGNSRQGNTPSAKVESASAGTTPMNRQVSMHRQSSTAGGKPNQQNGADSAKDANSKAKQANDAKQEAPQLAPVDPWATATIDPTELSQFFQPFEAGAGGAISDMNVYRSITPNDTPESSKDGVSEPNSDISDGVALDINLDVYFDDSWKPFGPSDTDPVFDLDNFDINGGLDSRVMFEEDPMAGNFSSWDEMVDPSAFDKPFSFDTSIYAMNVD